MASLQMFLTSYIAMASLQMFLNIYNVAMFLNIFSCHGKFACFSTSYLKKFVMFLNKVN